MIYIDLDETLILTDPLMCNKEGAVQFDLEDGKYCTLRRPIAHQLIRRCREIAEVRILTMGTRDYALAAVAAAELQVEPEHIVSRDDFLKTKFSGWVYTAEMETHASDVCTDAVLIDNQFHREGFADLKMRYLGISPLRYIKISPFTGKDNPYQIHKELEDILCRIKSLKS